MACGFESPDVPNNGALLDILHESLPILYSNKVVENSFSNTLELMLDTHTEIYANNGTPNENDDDEMNNQKIEKIIMNQEMELRCRKVQDTDTSNMKSASKIKSASSCLLLSFGINNIIPENSSLNVYNHSHCTEAARLRRCRSTASSNASSPVWSTGRAMYLRLEAMKTKPDDEGKRKSRPT